MEYRLALIGLGVVGQGIVEILTNERNSLQESYDIDLKVTAISDIRKGSVYDPEGIDLKQILDLVKEKDCIDDYIGGVKGWDSLKTIRESNADIVVEATETDIVTGEPGLTHMLTSIEHGKHVVTTNKGPLSLASTKLLDRAAEVGVHLRFEGTVLSGTPALGLATQHLAAAHIIAVHGIVNGTCNYILTEMEKGLTYDAALKQAQELGYAEADPSADVEGLDSLAKIIILANTLLGGNLNKDQVDCKGISEISREDVEAAKENGRRWKLIATAKVVNDNAIEAHVRPKKLPLDDPLAAVTGATNALTYETRYLGNITIIGPGAGGLETGYAILHDILDIHKKLREQ
ncbi:homoserine dehydrogenase [Candidatus Thorarchaeota archaeon]|nr:MAG: homoserine dehydrogenase [Candidatus Thorarchaeota archaeon]